MAQKTDNRSVGGRFEQEMAQRLADAGFWVHVLQQNKAGQPADLICAVGTYTTLIDCKVISGDAFPTSRVEENQRYAMSRFAERTGRACWFAFRLPDGEVRLMSANAVDFFVRHGGRRIWNDDILAEGYTVEEWIRYCRTTGGTETET